MYEKRCKDVDPEGYKMLVPDELEEEIEAMETDDISESVDDEVVADNTNVNEPKDDDTDEEKEEEELNNDPVRKHQFRYDDSICLTEKYPEVKQLQKFGMVESPQIQYYKPGQGFKIWHYDYA